MVNGSGRLEAGVLEFLHSEAARARLAELEQVSLTPAAHLGLAERLRRDFSAEQVHWLLETADLRRRAAAKFSRAADMFFTRAGLEMSSAEALSLYRAGRYQRAGLRAIADLACGLGGDAIGLTRDAYVTGVDHDPVALALAGANLVVYGAAECFTPRLADLGALLPFPCDAIFADPARRDEAGRRLRSVEAYRPPLATLRRWQTHTPHMGIKISPGVADGDIPAGAEVEFISLAGEVREAVLWWGDLRTTAGRRATVLTAPSPAYAATAVYTLTATEQAPPIPLAEPRAYLFEPDGAVIRAHLVGQVAAAIDGAQLDATIAYLTADAPTATPFGRFYALEAWFPFQLKRLRAHLRARHIGRVTIKKRGSPLDVAWLAGQLRLHGSAESTLFLTRLRGAPIVLVGQPV